ncbi:MAG: YceI family protein [Burkholderiaceae bacterium]
MRGIALPLFAVLLAAGPAAAQEQSFTIDPRHTFPAYEIEHLGVSPQPGRFNETQGRVILDPALRRGSVEVTIKARSIDTGVAALDRLLRSEDFFDVERFPEVGYRSTRARFDGERLVGVEGDLTIRGVTRPVALDVQGFRCTVQLLAQGKRCGATLTTTIKRSEFGMTKFAGSVISDEVRIRIAVEAVLDQ